MGHFLHPHLRQDLSGLFGTHKSNAGAWMSAKTVDRLDGAHIKTG